MNEPEQRPYRYERKFLVENLDVHQVGMLIRRHPSMFYAPYPPRFVNNLYLDTEDLQNYARNISGVGERHKVRIRWYGDLFGEIQKPVLEFKIKRGLVGTKIAYPLPPFQLDEQFNHVYLQRLLLSAELPEHIHQYLRQLLVVLCNRYYRWYYASRDQRFRLTVDAEMVYYPVKRAANHFMHRFVDANHVVVELKYEKPFDTQADRITGYFPFSLSRNSKYVIGIERVYLQG